MIIAIDFDGTIVEHQYPDIGAAAPGAFEWIPKFREAGATLILWTMRSDSNELPLLTDAVKFCRRNGVEFDLVNQNPQRWTTSPKVYADIYIDDSALGCPCIELDDSGKRRVADWGQIGPLVLERLEHRAQLLARKRKAVGNAFPYPVVD